MNTSNIIVTDFGKIPEDYAYNLLERDSLYKVFWKQKKMEKIFH